MTSTKLAPIDLFRIYISEHFDTKFILDVRFLHKKQKSPVNFLVNIFLKVFLEIHPIFINIS